MDYVHSQLNRTDLSETEKVALNLAANRIPYLREMGMTDAQRALAMERERLRRNEAQAALARREELLQEERLKRNALARTENENSRLERAAKEAADAEAALAAANAKRAAEAEARAIRERKAAQKREAALAARKAAEARAAAEAARKAAEREAAATAARKAADQRVSSHQKAAEAKAAAKAARAAAKAEAEAKAARRAAEIAEKARVARQAKEAKAAELAAKKAAEAEAAAAAARKAAEVKSAAAAAAAKKVPPAPIPVAKVPESMQPAGNAKGQVAYLPPDENLPPPIENVVPKSKSLMNYVDLVIQVKKQPAPLFQNPGDTPLKTTLPAEAKGRADFEVMIGDEKWYQVKSKKGNGWINGKYLSVFNLSPGSEAPVTAPTSRPSDLEGGRKESTYFESSVDNAPIFPKPSDTAKPSGTLTESTPYLAIRSEKVGANRWFLLQIRADETAWARGTDLQLADVQQPNILEIPTQKLSQRGKQSAFKAEWVTPSVKGVGVYTRPSIAAKMVKQVNPKDIFKVVESKSTGGSEWYRIELNAKLSGWVQTMDVQLTKKPD
jgi:hypothetical protein